MEHHRKLSLSRERLAELTPTELESLAGGDAAQYTGNPFCVLSIGQPCVTSFCTLLCH